MNACSDHYDSVAFPVLMKLGGTGVFDGLIRSLSENVGCRFRSTHEIAMPAVKAEGRGRRESRYQDEVD
jgi:hypothetical protein